MICILSVLKRRFDSHHSVDTSTCCMSSQNLLNILFRLHVILVERHLQSGSDVTATRAENGIVSDPHLVVVRRV